MAAERFILASRVGEAALLLPESMLVDYDGEVDANYPARLAARIRSLWQNPQAIEERRVLGSLAETLFSYKVLSKQFSAVIASVTVSGRSTSGSQA